MARSAEHEVVLHGIRRRTKVLIYGVLIGNLFIFREEENKIENKISFNS